MAESPTGQRTALVTDVMHFIGLSSARALQADGLRVLCQDASFTDASVRASFDADNPGLEALSGQSGAELKAECGRHGLTLDVLVNNDAFPAERAPIDEADPNRLRQTLDALVVTAFDRTAAFVPDMKTQGHGKIIFVTSAAPLRGLPNYSMYATARGATNALALSLAMELARHNIQVNAVAPNFIKSPTYFPDALMANPDTAAKILKNVPLGRLGTQEEAASVVAYLARPDASFITGQVLALAGGWA